MGARGKKPRGQLTAVPDPSITAVDRPAPPAELTDEQATVWMTIVNSLPAEWFRPETHELLASYCRHAIAARRVANLIEAFESEEADAVDVEHYDRLLKMQEREGRAMSSLATRMRMSQQSTYDKKVQKPKGAKKPWG